MNIYLQIIEDEELLNEVLNQIFFGIPASPNYKNIEDRLNNNISFFNLFLWGGSKYGHFFWNEINKRLNYLVKQNDINYLSDYVKITRSPEGFCIIDNGKLTLITKS